MADFDIPADLIQLRRDFEAANTRWAEAQDPESTRAAYEEAGRLAEALQDHPWWADCGGNRFEARKELILAARQPETGS